ncbi:MAG: polymer-forming cytoskeletal protein [Nitrospiraceae bacterium]|nr:MAG: polymer-forming cytoskeletal protein [Nitrospiraceae bacterium]
MLKKWVSEKNNGNTDSLEKDPPKETGKTNGNMNPDNSTGERKINNILKGSKVTGDINVTCDLVLSGDVKGNITAKDKSNIVIKGSCSGNIESGMGDVDIRGELRNGNITTGGNVSISGKFTGGEVKAQGKIFVNCEFSGRLEGTEIEIGANARVKGELFYREYISVSRGAKVEVHLCRLNEESKKEDKKPEKKVEDIKPPVNKLVGVQ